ncbi:MAG: acyl-CoA dehydrogenase [FCB group bacterium]|nr:acyl-CoA dehydrogenase [FCB group bacterium]
MDFSYSEEHEMIRQTAREFAENVLAKTAAERDKTESFPHDEMKELGELGFMGIFVPEEFDGAGMDAISYIIALEEISRVDASVGVILSVTNSLACYPILKYGTDFQKEKYLKGLASGKYLGGYCLTEPDSGSDAATMSTTAVPDGDHYVLNGTKNFITSGLTADLFIVSTVTDKSQGTHGTTAFIVERNTPGIIYGAKEKKMGIRSSDTATLTMEDCRIPVENRLGEEGEGFKVAMTALDSGRLGIAAQALGIAQAALEESVKYSNERHQFGRPISSFQAIQFKIADMESRIQAARLLTFKAAYLKDQGLRNTKEAATAKLFASETATWAADQAVQIHGGYGYTKEYLVERLFRDSRVTEIYEGTSEIQRLVIGNWVLKEY